jgi:hypothetical protein
MIPYHAVAALATDRHNALLAEAQATRLARQARCYRQQSGTAANRRSRLRRFRRGSAAAPESLAVTTLGRANGRSPVPTDLGCDAPTAAAPTGVSTMSPPAITAREGPVEVIVISPALVSRARPSHARTSHVQGP